MSKLTIAQKIVHSLVDRNFRDLEGHIISPAVSISVNSKITEVTFADGSKLTFQTN